MKNKLTSALLFAGLFLSVSVHADDCSVLAGTLENFLTIPKTSNSTCPQTYRRAVGASECILEKHAGDAGEGTSFVCSDFDTYFIGGPYRYTGAKSVTTPPELVLAQPPAFSDEDLVTVGGNWSSQTSASLTNIATRLNTIINKNYDDSYAIRGYVFDAAQSVRQTLAYSEQRVINNVNDRFSDVSYVLDRAQTAQEIRESANRDLILEKIEELPTEAESQEDFDEVLEAVKAVETQVTYLQGQLDDPMTREAKHNELLQASNQAAWNAEDAYNRINSTREIVRDVEDLSEEILSIVQNGSGGGGSGDGSMDETNSILTDFQNDVNNSTVTTQNQLIAVNDRLDGLLGQGQGLSNQLGQQLSGIQLAIENSSGGGGGPTADTGTHERLDALNAKTSQLNENVVDSALNTQQAISTSSDELLAELMAIKGALENGSSEYDDTEINEKLTALINNTGTTGNNVVTSGQATQQAVAASGQQVTDAVNGLGEKLDGISESIDGLGNAFEAGSGQNTGPTLCTGDDCYKGKSWITPKYPEGMISIYETHKAAFQGSSIHSYLEGFNPNISGSAPTNWNFCVDVGFANLGCHSLELPPYILAFVRLIILITAGFLCRRLIFGG